MNGVVKDEERAYVSMPGDPPGRCRRLRKWLYGMRPAANAWEEDFSGKLAGMGLKAGKSSSVVFCDVEREVRCVVHGDDFTFLAYEDDLERLRVAMSEAYLMTVRGVLGPDPKDQKEITILNRKLVWSEGGLTYEADANHARKILEDMGAARVVQRSGQAVHQGDGSGHRAGRRGARSAGDDVVPKHRGPSQLPCARPA